jgi:hypothetical protein
VTTLVRGALVLALLALPLFVVAELPKLLGLVGSIPGPAGTVAMATPVAAFSLIEPTRSASPNVGVTSRIAPLNDTPPPTLAPPAMTATPVPTPLPTPTGERISIGNTGGLGAVLRSDPVTGRPVAALHDQQTLDVLERRNVPGSGDWVHVRTADGKDGWITGVVAIPAPSQSH